MDPTTSNFFTAPAGDWATSTIKTLSGSGTIISNAVGTYNMGFCAIAGLLVVYLLVRSIYETAHSGKVMGKANSLWFTPRLVMAIALITPVPAGNGFNLGQYVGFGSMTLGVGLASNVWAAAVSSAATMQPLLNGVPPEVGALTENLFNLEFCMAMQNVTNSNSNSAKITESNPPAYDGPGRMVISYDGDPSAGGVAGQCGQIVFAKSNNTQSSAAQQNGAPAPMNVDPIFNAQVSATRALQLQLRPLATQLVPKFLPPYQDVSATAIDVTSAQQTYQNTVSSAAQSLITSQNADLSVFKNAATNGGFVKAGAWALNLLTANETVQSAVGAVPSVTPPRYHWWDDDVYVGQKAAMAAARIWWEEHYAVQQSNISEAAYSATSEKSTGEMAKIESILGPNNVKSLFDTFLLGYSCTAATTTSSAVCTSGSQQANPIAAMGSLGDGLLKAAWGSISAYSAMKAGFAAAEKAAEVGAIAASATPVVGSAVGTGAAIAAAGSTFAKEFVSSFSPMLWFLLFEMFGAGIMMAYILPLTPALVWFYGIARYLMTGVMTVAGANMWAIAHLELEGDGVGQRASPGWLIMMGLTVRPAIMTIGLILGLAVYTLLGQLFGLVYFEMASNNVVGGIGGLTGLLTYTIVGGALICSLCGICVGYGVGEGPDYVMRLVGEHLHRSGDPAQDAQGVGRSGNVGGDLKQGGLSMRSEIRDRERQEKGRSSKARTNTEKSADRTEKQEQYLARDD